MSVPGIVQSALDGEEIAARVSLGGDDELFITPSSTILYRAEGLLSDESVDEYPHEADRLTLSEGRRKTRFTLEYALDGTREFTVPSSHTDRVLTPILAGVLNGNGITDPGESVVETYRFSELTLIITSDRLVKHIGEAVWDEDYEGYHYDDVASLTFEDGSVATQIVLEVDGRQQRIKAPNEDADDVRERLKRALCAYHDVDSLETFNRRGQDDDDPERDGETDPSAAFGDGVDPLDADPPAAEADDGGADGSVQAEPETTDPLAEGRTESGASSQASGDAGEPASATVESGGESRDARRSDADEADRRDGGATASQADSADDRSPSGADQKPAGGAGTTDERSFAESGFEPATASADPELLERLEALEATVDRQSKLLEKQQQTIEQLIAELRQGR